MSVSCAIRSQSRYEPVDQPWYLQHDAGISQARRPVETRTQASTHAVSLMLNPNLMNTAMNNGSGTMGM